MTGPVVLDASATLAYLQREPGGAAVVDAIVDGAAISAVNWAEVLSKLAEGGQDPGELDAAMVGEGLAGSTLAVVEMAPRDAPLVARLRHLTRRLGLSLADRVCLALAVRMDRPVLTADRVWSQLRIGVDIHVIRP